MQCYQVVLATLAVERPYSLQDTALPWTYATRRLDSACKVRRRAAAHLTLESQCRSSRLASSHQTQPNGLHNRGSSTSSRYIPSIPPWTSSVLSIASSFSLTVKRLCTKSIARTEVSDGACRESPSNRLQNAARRYEGALPCLGVRMRVSARKSSWDVERCPNGSPQALFGRAVETPSSKVRDRLRRGMILYK